MRIRSNRNRILIAAALVAASASFTPTRADAQVHVDIGIPLPSISFHVAPQLVALPGTYVYVAPDYDAEIFFYDGFWWRPWEGRWYRSSYYDRGWEIYGSVPVFYSSIPRDWRTRYHNHDWDGRRWDYERVGYDDVKRNWSSWKRERRWDSAVRASGDRDYRTDRSRGDGDRRLEDRRDSDRRIEQRNAPAPDRRMEQRSAPAPERRIEQRSAPTKTERRVEQRSAPSKRSQGPARVERSQPSGKSGATKTRSSGGDRGGSNKGGGGNQRGGGGGEKGGKGHN